MLLTKKDAKFVACVYQRPAIVADSDTEEEAFRKVQGRRFTGKARSYRETADILSVVGAGLAREASDWRRTYEMDI